MGQEINILVGFVCKPWNILFKKVSIILLIFSLVFVASLTVSAQVNLDFSDNTMNGWTGSMTEREDSITREGFLQHCVMTPAMNDPLIPGLSVVPPGKTHSVRVCNTAAGGQLATLKQTFRVDSSNMIFSYSYAVVLEDPAGAEGHGGLNRPHFLARLTDENGDVIKCAEYTVIVETGLQGFTHNCVNMRFNPRTTNNVGCPNGAVGSDRSGVNRAESSVESDESCNANPLFGPRDIYYKDWETISVALNEYYGQEVTIEFVASDCTPGGHRGYAYVAAETKPLDVSKPGTICEGKETKQIVAPANFRTYSWTGPDGGIEGATDVGTITITKAGTYTVQLTPFTDSEEICTIPISYTARPFCPVNTELDTSLCETIRGSGQTLNVNLNNYNEVVTVDGEFGNVRSWHNNYPANDLNMIADPTSVTVSNSDKFYAVAVSSTRSDTVEMVFTINAKPSASVPFIDPVCVGAPAFQINGATPAGGIFLGEGIDANGLFNPTIAGEFDISYIVSNEDGCIDTSTNVVLVMEPPKGNLPEEIIICEDDPVPAILDPGEANIYEWEPNGESSRTISVTAPGQYIVTLFNGPQCSATYSTMVKSVCPPVLYISDAFSPNNDSQNTNELYNVYGKHIGAFEMYIFNRWGEVIYKSSKWGESWDGKYRGKPMDLGVYPWIITYEGDSEEYRGPYKKEGSVTLIR